MPSGRFPVPGACPAQRGPRWLCRSGWEGAWLLLITCCPALLFGRHETHETGGDGICVGERGPETGATPTPDDSQICRANKTGEIHQSLPAQAAGNNGLSSPPQQHVPSAPMASPASQPRPIPRRSCKNLTGENFELDLSWRRHLPI